MWLIVKISHVIPKSDASVCKYLNSNPWFKQWKLSRGEILIPISYLPAHDRSWNSVEWYIFKKNGERNEYLSVFCPAVCLHDFLVAKYYCSTYSHVCPKTWLHCLSGFMDVCTVRLISWYSKSVECIPFCPIFYLKHNTPMDDPYHQWCPGWPTWVLIELSS